MGGWGWWEGRGKERQKCEHESELRLCKEMKNKGAMVVRGCFFSVK